MNCLDSSFLVDFLDPEQPGHEAAKAWMEGKAVEQITTLAVCAFEVLCGTARVSDDRFDRAVGLLRTLEVVELDLAGAAAAGTLDGRLHADGEPLSAREALVASPAREHGDTLVTRDRDFVDVPGLDVVLHDE
jgi:predicted nucleic acid-binding protein